MVTNRPNTRKKLRNKFVRVVGQEMTCQEISKHVGGRDIVLKSGGKDILLRKLSTRELRKLYFNAIKRKMEKEGVRTHY